MGSARPGWLRTVPAGRWGRPGTPVAQPLRVEKRRARAFVCHPSVHPLQGIDLLSVAGEAAETSMDVFGQRHKQLFDDKQNQRQRGEPLAAEAWSRGCGHRPRALERSGPLCGSPAALKTPPCCSPELDSGHLRPRWRGIVPPPVPLAPELFGAGLSFSSLCSANTKFMCTYQLFFFMLPKYT